MVHAFLKVHISILISFIEIVHVYQFDELNIKIKKVHVYVSSPGAKGDLR